jgi:hypothetical protein
LIQLQIVFLGVAPVVSRVTPEVSLVNLLQNLFYVRFSSQHQVVDGKIHCHVSIFLDRLSTVWCVLWFLRVTNFLGRSIISV